MSKAAIQASVLNNGSSLAVAANAQITVRNLAGSIVVLYSTREGTGNPGNPFNANANGYFLVYADPGVYDITVTTSSGSQVYKHVVALAEATGISGTFTPALTFGGLSTGIIYLARQGHYVKSLIGGGVSEVSLMGYVNVTDKGTATGLAEISNLPFSVYYPASGLTGLATFRFHGITHSGTVQGLASAANSRITLEQVSDAGTLSSLANTNFATVCYLGFDIRYLTQD